MPILLALALLILTAALPADAKTYKISSPEFLDSAVVARLLTEAYAQMGHDLEFVIRPAKRSLAEVNSGVSDAEMGRVIGVEREYPNLVRVEEPIYALSMSAIVAKTSKHWLSSWEEIGKHRIAYPRGYKFLDVRTRGMNAVRAKDATAVARLVNGGRVDFGITLTSDAERLETEFEHLSAIKPPLEVVTLYHYLNVKHRRLVPKLEKILVEFNDSGRSKQIILGTKP